MSDTLRIGTRGSALALAQSGTVAEALGGGTRSSWSRSRPPATRAARPRPEAGGDKARFVREIERALLDGEIDLAVHSAKDLPGEMPDGLALAGVPPREDPADAWIGPGRSLDEVPEGAAVGTASACAAAASCSPLRPDLEVVELRGNVDTRLRKLAEGEYRRDRARRRRPAPARPRRARSPSAFGAAR